VRRAAVQPRVRVEPRPRAVRGARVRGDRPHPRRGRRRGRGHLPPPPVASPVMDLRIFTEPQQGASYDQQLAMARVTEDAGFSAYFRSDHLMAFMGDGLPGPSDSWVTLGALARETTRVRLGTLVTSMTFRWPGLLA